MPLFMIDRDFGDDDESSLELAALRALACSYWFDNLRWIRSFAHEGRSTVTCYYEADSEADIREHARIASIPCDNIRAVTEIGPEMFEGREGEGSAELIDPSTDFLPAASKGGREH